MHSTHVFGRSMLNVYYLYFIQLHSFDVQRNSKKKGKRVSPMHHRVSLLHKCAAVVVQVLVRTQFYEFALWCIPLVFFFFFLHNNVEGCSATVVLSYSPSHIVNDSNVK